MTYRLTILGCGSSTGVPRITGDWGACDPENPRNRRRRCSALIEKFGPEGATVVLIDTSPDVREQLLAARVTHIDGVLFTHDHADHTHGLDDLRMFAYARRGRIPAYADAYTLGLLQHRFDYCFKTPPGSSYPAILEGYVIAPPQPIRVLGAGGELAVIPFRQQHGDIGSLGFRVRGVAYSSDLNDLPEESFEALRDLDIWIVDALRHTPHGSHLSVSQALNWIARINPKRAILTHMHIDLDYDMLSAQLPSHVVPAFDGMTVAF